ncbi:hypothetical protein CFBP6625_24910 (plasmid) [Agrobacterium tumefaciens]|uniref:PIN domain-containing protein n=1 Tax=Agrobacterium pusense TaxID=648995 RepID=UPI000D1B39B5|nr:PIN domain-containing protein [Agrobacterium pusense]QCM13673.1 hypothetical protein CFBP6625_24910 [Agrobacterium tumefaciens]
MLHLLIDTCVWLDLSKDYRSQPLISALEDLVAADEIRLIVPQIVVDEFLRNKSRVTAEAQRSLQSHFRLVREAVNQFGAEEIKAPTLQGLNEVDHKIATGSDAVLSAVETIEKLLLVQSPVPTTDTIKGRVTDRALANLAPYHRSKNSVGDAILIELYADAVAHLADDGARFGFVTHNIKDFSDPNGDRRLPHPDLVPLFLPPKSRYWVSLLDTLKDVDPDLLEDHDAEFNYSPQFRRLSEILEAEHLLFRQVWYNRHWNLRTEIEDGTHHVVPESEYSRSPYRQDQTLDTIWAGALAAAKRTEDEVGIDNLGPWSDFEWGMINGKLSALRWVTGDDWDMLDT